MSLWPWSHQSPAPGSEPPAHPPHLFPSLLKGPACSCPHGGWPRGCCPQAHVLAGPVIRPCRGCSGHRAGDLLRTVTVEGWLAAVAFPVLQPRELLRLVGCSSPSPGLTDLCLCHGAGWAGLTQTPASWLLAGDSTSSCSHINEMFGENNGRQFHNLFRKFWAEQRCRDLKRYVTL